MLSTKLRIAASVFAPPSSQTNEFDAVNRLAALSPAYDCFDQFPAPYTSSKRSSITVVPHGLFETSTFDWAAAGEAATVATAAADSRRRNVSMVGMRSGGSRAGTVSGTPPSNASRGTPPTRAGPAHRKSLRRNPLCREPGHPAAWHALRFDATAPQ